MRKLLALVGTFFILSSLNAASLFEEFNTKILDLNGRFATVENSDNIVVGSSGIVLHSFKDGSSTIVARAEVVKKDNDKATIKFEVFKYLAQDAFPKPGILPQVGDQVKLNYLYNRSLIVAPNYNVYKEVTEHFKDIQWVHPDIFGAYLAKEYRPNPDREIFQKVCSLNSTGLVFFALERNAYFVDCNNFKVLKTLKGGHIKTAQAPFYTRVKGIETSWIKWSGSYINDYNSYYRNLLRN
ncbi:plasminogen-binding N-terminal domain-containing protein [Sulfurospirillum sp. 1307]